MNFRARKLDLSFKCVSEFNERINILLITRIEYFRIFISFRNRFQSFQRSIININCDRVFLLFCVIDYLSHKKRREAKFFLSRFMIS